VAIGDRMITLYSIDGGKTWTSQPRDLQLFKLRRRQYEKKVKELVSTYIPNDLD
jgi:hypothetical protein